jgi:hypothetical protein
MHRAAMRAPELGILDLRLLPKLFINLLAGVAEHRGRGTANEQAFHVWPLFRFRAARRFEEKFGHGIMFLIRGDKRSALWRYRMETFRALPGRQLLAG